MSLSPFLSITADAHAIIARLTDLAEPWRARFDDSTPLSTAVLFVHLGAMLVGGGLAIAADRGTWRAARAERSGARRRQLVEIAGTHRPVIAALTLVMLSGALLFLADVGTYATSVAFWVKMGLVAVLLGNGLLMTRLETKLRDDALGTEQRARRWRTGRA